VAPPTDAGGLAELEHPRTGPRRARAAE